MSTPSDAPVSWRRLLGEQCGLVSRGQVIGQGLSDEVIRAHLAAGRWQRVHHSVFATFTGPLPRAAQLRAALLYAGDPAVLSHRTAAEEWGLLPPNDTQPVHVTVPYGCSATSISCVRLHRSRAFATIATEADPPRTRRAQTVIDVAAAADDPAMATESVIALAAGKVPVRQLMSALTQRRPWRHHAAIQLGVGLLADGVLSMLEYRYLTDVEQRHHLPTAARQHPVVVDGHTLWEDCCYDATGVPLIVRLDGRLAHAAPEIAFRDRRRDNAAELAARPRLAFGWHDVDQDPCGVAAEVAAVLRREGWTGTLQPCPRCPPCGE
ncbi:MAG: hypothetical protein GEU83_10400 [Pseudonocardiaceae bacterium]|nr:hypothetical protein [Pseudonocardiaceae bacterium]